MSKNARFNLIPQEDAHGQKYYICKVETPMTINLSEGAVFLVFISEPGNEELQIGKLKDKNKYERK